MQAVVALLMQHNTYKYKNHKHFPHLASVSSSFLTPSLAIKANVYSKKCKINYVNLPKIPTLSINLGFKVTSANKNCSYFHYLMPYQLITKLTKTSIDTIPLRILSISASGTSLKQASQTPIILCKSSSIPFGDFSSDISAPRLLKYARSS